jgi:hypothetical protein
MGLPFFNQVGCKLPKVYKGLYFLSSRYSLSGEKNIPLEVFKDMALKKGDIIDERKNYEKSCGIAVEVLNGGGGFSNMSCCGYDLGENDQVENFEDDGTRAEGKTIKKGVVIDENKQYPNSCGLIVEVLAGGAGFQEIVCCGNTLTENDIV